MGQSYRNSDPAPPIMQGSPVPPDWRMPARDWDGPPWNRWAFRNIRSMVRTVDVPRGADVWGMTADLQDVSDVAYATHDGRASTWGQMLDETYTDAALIWLDGRILAESYWNGMTPRTPHIAYSVSKSITGAVAGSLIEEGAMDPAASITDLLPELTATAWRGATLQQVLDMTTGVVFDETYDDPHSHVVLLDVAAGWKPPYPNMDPDRVPACTWDLILSLTEADADHGARFEYRSIETDVLGHAMERASNRPLADLISERLWAPMGAEQDGFFTVDAAGFPLADGGFNGCLRDFARFGRLLLEDGARDGRQIVPKAWIDDIRGGDHGLFNDHGRHYFPNGRYRNQFWIEDAARTAHVSLGIYGQHIYVDPDRGLVAVKLSSWPAALSEDGDLINWLSAVKAVAAAHGA